MTGGGEGGGVSRNDVLEGRKPVGQQSRDTQEHILKVASRLMQTGGYHAFSYADIAAEVGITKASIHYHYPSKADLGQEALHTYRTGWQHDLRRLTLLGSTEARLRGYSRVYRDLLRGGGFCLVAALAPGTLLLPGAMQAELSAFYSEHQEWLEGVLWAGQTDQTLKVSGPLRVHAQTLISVLHGAMGLARAQRDVTLYCAAAHLTLQHLGLPVAELEISDPADAGRAELAAGLTFV